MLRIINNYAQLYYKYMLYIIILQIYVIYNTNICYI